MKAYLILEDGTVFTGTSIGSQYEVINEIVFNVSMTGYLEVLTNPSYAGQAVVMTYSPIGNYGIYHEDMGSTKPWPDGCIIRELSRIPSNFRSGDTIQNFLKEHDILGISGIDTRALTKILREKGTMSGIVTTEEYTDLSKPAEHMKGYSVTNVVLEASTKEKYVLPGHSGAPGGSFPGAERRVALMDYGARKNTVRSLNNPGCEVIVYPADTPTEEVLATCPDGIILSNSPGDPRGNTAIIEEIKKLYTPDIPVFAICLGYQLMALADGMDTYELKYGCRGGNHPVRGLETGRVYISSRDHGYVADMERVSPKVAVPAFVNVNNGTNEGLKYMGKDIFTIRYHPEACPGPLDSGYLFDRLLKMMEVKN